METPGGFSFIFPPTCAPFDFAPFALQTATPHHLPAAQHDNPDNKKEGPVWRAIGRTAPVTLNRIWNNRDSSKING